MDLVLNLLGSFVVVSGALFFKEIKSFCLKQKSVIDKNVGILHQTENNQLQDPIDLFEEAYNWLCEEFGVYKNAFKDEKQLTVVISDVIEWLHLRPDCILPSTKDVKTYAKHLCLIYQLYKEVSVDDLVSKYVHQTNKEKHRYVMKRLNKLGIKYVDNS